MPFTTQASRTRAMAYEAASARYSDMQYRVCGKSGLKLPALSLG
ncbi:MAG TPA: L-glyceraldehyde 3-phosphate reductase, partial [Paraburkholderia sp.]|nr:L-glyceraldehyde 3-phosphate reductase [Paraburkholderia sp.]